MEGRKVCRIPPKLESQAIVSHPKWKLGNEVRSWERAAAALDLLST